MHFNILTLFPEFFENPLKIGLLGKAREKGLLGFNFVNPREFATDKHRSVDDRPYGGGPGMVMSVEPLYKAYKSLSNPGKTILLTPKGRVLDQNLAGELALQENITLICGRYEGIDRRFEDLTQPDPISIGDFVLNGGESAALCLIEAVSRHIPDFMGCQESVYDDSLCQGLLEHPHYTRPMEYLGLKVPEILASGDHARIWNWRREQGLLETLKNRPELLMQARLTPGERTFLQGIARKRLGKNLYLALLHYPVLNKQGKRTSVSLTNLDIHDIARLCCSYGLGRYFIVTPLKDQQALAKRLIGHWLEGPGKTDNPDRVKAVRLVRVADNLKEVVERVSELTGQRPYVVATSAGNYQAISFKEVRGLLKDWPVLLLLGTGSGLAPEVIQSSDAVLCSIRGLDKYNHMSVRTAAAITVDRILGDCY